MKIKQILVSEGVWGMLPPRLFGAFFEPRKRRSAARPARPPSSPVGMAAWARAAAIEQSNNPNRKEKIMTDFETKVLEALDAIQTFLTALVGDCEATKTLAERRAAKAASQAVWRAKQAEKAANGGKREEGGESRDERAESRVERGGGREEGGARR